MKTATTFAQMLVRVTGLVQIVLGLLFWTGSALGLVPVHIASGLLLVLGLWVLAALAARAGVSVGFVLLAFAWGLLTIALGLAQGGLLPGAAHWVTQVLHLLVGIAAIVQAEALGQRLRGRTTPAVPSA